MEFLRHPPKEFVHPKWVNKYGDKVITFGGHRAACGMVITDISPYNLLFF